MSKTPYSRVNHIANTEFNGGYIVVASVLLIGSNLLNSEANAFAGWIGIGFIMVCFINCLFVSIGSLIVCHALC